jgi:hypothetical protein
MKPLKRPLGPVVSEPSKPWAHTITQRDMDNTGNVSVQVYNRLGEKMTRNTLHTTFGALSGAP